MTTQEAFTPTVEGESGEPTDEMIAAAGQYLGGEDYEWTAWQVWRAMIEARPCSARPENGAAMLILSLALDALDRCIEAWVQGEALTDDEGRDFTAALMAANRIVNPNARAALNALREHGKEMG